MTIASGTHLGRYEIRSQLGSGGMGEVYLAQDTKLERTVALKFLPEEIASDSQRMHRFVQEAKAASALNHPNILTIHEVDHIGSTNFIATEFIDGETLRQRMRRVRMSVQEALDVAIQVATALAAAHEAGIIHRDIKPENIMLRKRDGIVKVLDFGLAKLKDRMVSAVDTEAATRALVNTAPGTVIGTATYMSPEQARGLDVDERTDLWSLGIVLYEMLAGHVPFTGSTATDVIAAIVKTEPPPVSEAAPEVPARLEEIVLKALEKDREDRYQTVKDLLVDLRRLRKRLDIESGLERSVPPGPRAPLTSQITSQTLSEPARPTSSAEYLVTEIKRHQTGALLGLAGFVLLIGGIAFAFYRFGGQTKPAPVPFQNMKMAKLTSNGKAIAAAISPDGKQVVYVVDDGGRRSLWLRQVATLSDVQLAAPENIYYWGLTTSRDGNFLYYFWGGAGIQNRTLYQMSVFGGTSRKVIEDVSSPVGLSTDGKLLAFVRNNQSESALMIANADGTEERKIATRQSPKSFGNLFNGSVAWSSDSKRIASIAQDTDSAGRFMNVVEIVVADGTERPLTSRRWYGIRRLAWLADGSGLLMTAAEHPSDFFSQQLWYLSYASGEAQKITNDLNHYENLSLSADSGTLVTLQQARSANVWIAPNGDATRAKQLTSLTSKLDGLQGVAWTPDGKIVYHSMAGGSEGIWIMDADGNNRSQLTTGETVDYQPSVSRDGRYIVFVSERTGTRSIWRINIDGSNPKQLTLTSVVGNNPPQCTPDNQVVYQSAGALWKVSIDGGEPVKIGEDMRGPAVSPDGKLIAYSLGMPGSFDKLAVFSIDGGSSVKTYDAQLEGPGRIRWAPDGRAVTYVSRQNGISDIWSQPIDFGEPKKLTDFKADRIFSFDWSRENKLVISYGTNSSDIVLIRNIK